MTLPRGLQKKKINFMLLLHEMLIKNNYFAWDVDLFGYRIIPTNKPTKKRLFLLRFKCIICNGNYAESNRRSRGNSNIVDIFHICIMKEVKKKTVKIMANWASAIIHNEWMFTFHLTNVIHNNINWKRNAVWCTFLLIEIACTRLPF